MPSPVEPSISEQTRFWNDWNASTRAHRLGEVPERQRQVLESWFKSMPRRGREILDVGCGTGWLEPTLLDFGSVTATDLAGEVIAQARERCPNVTFLAGDFLTLPLPEQSFDVAVCLEVLAHVVDQREFVARIATLLRPGGILMLSTQNRPVLEHFNRIPPPGVGQVRQWVDRRELRALLEPEFQVHQLFTVTPLAGRGIMRYINSQRVNRPVRKVAGDRVEHLKERLGFGWTIMCRAQRRP
jgi:2-polyprenyl-3-methyl-5-hydroxy-6-metoxy-1,4-benzoquinol methylase